MAAFSSESTMRNTLTSGKAPLRQFKISFQNNLFKTAFCTIFPSLLLENLLVFHSFELNKLISSLRCSFKHPNVTRGRKTNDCRSNQNNIVSKLMQQRYKTCPSINISLRRGIVFSKSSNIKSIQ